MIGFIAIASYKKGKAAEYMIEDLGNKALPRFIQVNMDIKSFGESFFHFGRARKFYGFQSSQESARNATTEKRNPLIGHQPQCYNHMSLSPNLVMVPSW